jgi:hypothetical protein
MYKVRQISVRFLYFVRRVGEISLFLTKNFVFFYL